MHQLTLEETKKLEHEFFLRVPKARRIDPFFQSICAFMCEVKEVSGKGKKVLNIYKSDDMSGGREEVYKDQFLNECDLTGIDFAKDAFVYDGKPMESRHSLPFGDNSFDVIVTTKYIMEHISEPYDVLRELHRVLKPGGEVFLVAGHVRRQHQAPHDYFRFTEYALEHLVKKAGFSSYTIKPTDGAMYTLGMYSYFFQRIMPFPKFVERFFDLYYYYVIQPVYFFFHSFDRGYGRDLSSYFTVRAKK
jgi:ubiquinone/menaquinone biosynthesis C-methylase UbiE